PLPHKTSKKFFLYNIAGINSISTHPNKNYDGINLSIVNLDSAGNVTLKVSAPNDRITKIVLWAEIMINETEQHIGSFLPIVGHAFFSGCDGKPKSTITDYDDFKISSNIVYVWSAPQGTTIYMNDPRVQSKRELPKRSQRFIENNNYHHRKGYSLTHNKHRTSEQHEEYCRHHHNERSCHSKLDKHRILEKYCRHHPDKHNCHKMLDKHRTLEKYCRHHPDKHSCHKMLDKHRTLEKYCRHHHDKHKCHNELDKHRIIEKYCRHHPDEHKCRKLENHQSDGSSSTPKVVAFYFKGAAFLESNPVNVTVFSSDIMFISGDIPPYNNSSNEISNSGIENIEDNSSISSSASSFISFKSFGLNLALLLLLVGFLQ
ncbi:16076_t:CDS:2, partial [Racocetra persica]